MTTSELSNIDLKNQRGNLDTIEDLSSKSPQKKLFTLKVVEYLLVAAFVSALILVIIFSTDKQLVIVSAVTLVFSLFLFLLNRQAIQESKNAADEYNLSKKAELYSYLLSNSNSVDKNTFTPVRGKALQYCQELINDYKKTRNWARTLYYTLQIATVILSGVTPILVLVDKLEAGQAWLKWLPVICPAVASIVASIVTSFPFQKNWIAANTAVELLEAEQEKFVLGVTPPYRCYDLSDEVEQQQKASQALEYFITQVNNIHLNQVQQAGETQSDKTEKKDKTEATPSSESKQEQS
ncbi:DUF4231 domain-containing protein [Nostoc sp. CENA67]|uniref:DUF4231 domain-containing protein n=1 Tax=Amazonocrinis nigriterrae CENA67 TaxID=2794033 RepID=A0A8J7HQZ9_9NOST|nr:DUF4231 domain-containing protein [Amazonocrinis nigriterrae]MBH8562485.1 DUF4231 domain-containing protein [Amazonocrinis nigriterrae CENA67]